MNEFRRRILLKRSQKILCESNVAFVIVTFRDRLGCSRNVEDDVNAFACSIQLCDDLRGPRQASPLPGISQKAAYRVSSRDRLLRQARTDETCRSGDQDAACAHAALCATSRSPFSTLTRDRIASPTRKNTIKERIATR